MSLLTPTCNTERLNIERLLARIAVIGGAVFWIVMFWANQTGAKYSNLVYSAPEVEKAFVSALIPLAVAVVVFVVALFYEYLAAFLLFFASLDVIIWGLIADWSAQGPLLWMTALAVLVAPMLIAGVLFLLAARTAQVCTLQEKGA